jgi:hypothetical protein
MSTGPISVGATHVEALCRCVAFMFFVSAALPWALTRRAANPSVCDAAGNTPGHLAAMHGHLLVLTELVKVCSAETLAGCGTPLAGCAADTGRLRRQVAQAALETNDMVSRLL